MPVQIDIFFSYAHEDEALRDQLAVHLSALRQGGMIREWHDRQLKPGDDWEKELDSQIEKAHVILLLVSVDFAASKYCVGVEMKRALERHATGAARVIPVILRACRWQNMPLAKLQVLPKDGVPIVSWSNRDEAWMSVVDGILTIVNEIQDKQAPHEAENPALQKPTPAAADREGSAAGGALAIRRGRRALLVVAFYVLSILVCLLLRPGLPFAELLPRVGLGLMASALVFGTLRSSSNANGTVPSAGSKGIAFQFGAAALFVVCLAWPGSIESKPETTSGGPVKEPSSEPRVSAPPPLPDAPIVEETTKVTIRFMVPPRACPPPSTEPTLIVNDRRIRLDFDNNCVAGVVLPSRVVQSASGTLSLSTRGVRLEDPTKKYELAKGEIRATLEYLSNSKSWVRY